MCDCKEPGTEQEVMVNTAIKTIQGLVKSKTVWSNAVGLPTVLLALKSLGIATTNPLIIGGAYVIANIFLRIITKSPLHEK